MSLQLRKASKMRRARSSWRLTGYRPCRRVPWDSCRQRHRHRSSLYDRKEFFSAVAFTPFAVVTCRSECDQLIDKALSFARLCCALSNFISARSVNNAHRILKDAVPTPLHQRQVRASQAGGDQEPPEQPLTHSAARICHVLDLPGGVIYAGEAVRVPTRRSRTVLGALAAT